MAAFQPAFGQHKALSPLPGRRDRRSHINARRCVGVYIIAIVAAPYWWFGAWHVTIRESNYASAVWQAQDPMMKISVGLKIVGIVLCLASAVYPAAAQDVPGIEICTHESRLDRRTSCLQSNVEFLQQIVNKNALDAQQKLNAANRDIAALKDSLAAANRDIAALKEAVANAQALTQKSNSQAKSDAKPDAKLDAKPDAKSESKAPAK
jgi:hypothetical protein